MEIKAKVKHVRMSPKKIRLVADIIRGMKTAKALAQLKFVNKKATKPIKKLIESGMANAEHNYEIEKNNLYIKEIKVDEGATLRRWMPRAHGRATPIRKRSSHISLILAEIKDSGKKKAKKQKIDSPIKLGVKPEKDEGVKIKNKSKENKEEKINKAEIKKEITDTKMEGKRGHAKIEGSSEKGFSKKIFRRKSG